MPLLIFLAIFLADLFAILLAVGLLGFHAGALAFFACRADAFFTALVDGLFARAHALFDGAFFDGAAEGLAFLLGGFFDCLDFVFDGGRNFLSGGKGNSHADDQGD